MEIKIGEIYKHFKGNMYKVICVAKHSETGEKMVIYQALYGENEIYARPLNMFLEKVDKNKYPDATQEYRFEPWNSASLSPAANVSTISNVETEVLFDDENDENPNIDPRVIAFLDARNYDEKLSILQNMRRDVTDEMINTMAFGIDIELNEGTCEEKYNELLNCVMLKEKFECNRLRQ